MSATGNKAVLQVEKSGCAIQLFFNGIEIFREMVGGQVTVQIPLNPWIVAGPNQFEIHVSNPTGVASLPDFAACSAALIVQTNAGEDFTPLRVAAKRRDHHPPGACPLQSIGGEYDFGGTKRWIWQVATPVDDPARRKTDVIRQLERLWHFFEEKDLDSILRFLLLRNQELAAAYGSSVEETEAECRELFEDLLYGEWILAPLKDADASLRSSADGRISWLETRKGNSPLYYLSLDRAIASFVPIRFCEHQGQLVAVR